MISFIVPIYNAEPYLRTCVQSLLEQTVRAIEVLLIDDGSTDGSWSIAQDLCAQDPRVKAWQQSHAGQSAARNLGLSHAQGEYIAFVDADDTIEPDWCERHLAAIEGVDYVQSGYQRVQETKVLYQKTPAHRYQFISPCMRLYRRACLQELSFVKGMIYEDVIWSVDLWMRPTTCRLIRYTGYTYTYNPVSTSSVPHPEARKNVFRLLRQRARQASCKIRLIIAYTMLRLYLHFITARR